VPGDFCDFVRLDGLEKGSVPFIIDSQVLPDLQQEKRTYRYFSAADKQRILAEADTCERGELGALLRREGIYDNKGDASLFLFYIV
jgi:hypothetical protein